MEEQFRKEVKNIIPIIFISVTISLWLYGLWSRRSLYRFIFSFPGVFSVTFFQCFIVTKLFKEFFQFLTTWFERLNTNTLCAWLGFHPAIISSDLGLIEKVLSSSELLNKAEYFYTPLHEVLNGGIISSPAPLWQRNRKLINPAFRHKVLVNFFPTFLKGTNTIVSELDKFVDTGEHRLFEPLLRTTYMVALETTMGLQEEYGSQRVSEFVCIYTLIMDKLRFYLLLCCVNLGSLFSLYYKYSRIRDRLFQMFKEMVEENLAKEHKKPKYEAKVTDTNSIQSIAKSMNKFIYQVIESYRAQKLSFQDLISESTNVAIAASETTATSTLHTLFLLATHPAVQQQLFEDIVSVLPNKDMEIKFEHLNQLPYLDMVVNESLRLAPSIPLIGRQITKDFRVSKDLVLPKGLQVILSIFHLHRRKDIWGPNANNFDPDNFLPENNAARHPYAYIPFSKGVRNCIGWQYALTSLKIMLIGILRNYRVTTTAKFEDIKVAVHFVLRYDVEPVLRIHRREY